MWLTTYIFMRFWTGAGTASGGGNTGTVVQSTKFHSNMSTMMNRRG